MSCGEPLVKGFSTEVEVVQDLRLMQTNLIFQVYLLKN